VAGPLVEPVDKLLAEREERTGDALRIFRPVGLDLQRADAARGVDLDRDESGIGARTGCRGSG
jgi:hypothetical protein